MDNPISIETTGLVYPYIVSSSYNNSNGSYYLEGQEVIINSQDVNNEPVIIADDYEYQGERYQVFTLATNKAYDSHNVIPHKLKANRDCELNFMLIGGGAPGGTSGTSSNRSNGPGGNAGSVITGKLQMKTNDNLNVTCYWDHYNPHNNLSLEHAQVNTLEWMGKEKDYSVIGGNISCHDDNYNSQSAVYRSCNSSFRGIVNDKPVTVVSGGAFWPVSDSSTNVIIYPTSKSGIYLNSPAWTCTVIGIDGVDMSTYDTQSDTTFISENFTIHKAREGGIAYYYKNSPSSFGLASGYSTGDTNSVIYESFDILGNQYILPCGGGAGGGDTFGYNVNYNTSVIPYKIASNSFAGSGVGGAGFGNRINQHPKRILDAWMPGAGGGGAFQDNGNALWSNGYGGQGVMLCWIKKT